jgi:hypothetical protein
MEFVGIPISSKVSNRIFDEIRIKFRRNFDLVESKKNDFLKLLVLILPIFTKTVFTIREQAGESLHQILGLEARPRPDSAKVSVILYIVL